MQTNSINSNSTNFKNSFGIGNNVSNECVFGYISGVIILISITIYLYYIILDYKDEHYRIRSVDKNIWIGGLFLLLIMSFFIMTFCLKN